MRPPLSLALVGSIALLAFGAAPSATHANDSAAELSVGGLRFTRSPDVSMESEELTISLDMVTVRYRFLNQSPKPVSLTVAFPLPEIDLSEAGNYAIPANDSANFVGFETKVDGKPVKFTMNQRAFLGGKDVSAKLREFGVPILPLGGQQNWIAELPQAARDRLIEDGLLAQSGSTEQGQPLYEPAWNVRTSAVRQQTFPPIRPVVVEHRYRTSLGISFDTVLRKGVRQNKGIENEVARYRKEYCISDQFLADLDKMAGNAEGNTLKVQERRISYVLTTGANWAGPIKQFKLLVDSKRAGRLVSFCGPNIRVVSPTVTEATATDFTPDKNLKVLVIGRF